MPESGDNELLAQYARNNSVEAFAVLVARHVNLVYSVAIRHVANLASSNRCALKGYDFMFESTIFGCDSGGKHPSAQ
jgi:hypothetical protein